MEGVFLSKILATRGALTSVTLMSLVHPVTRYHATLAKVRGSLGFRMMLAVDDSPRPAYGDCRPL